MRRLPATIEHLAGRRAARWIRESTSGQYDRYGPEAQAEMQDRAITRLGLTDSGLAWRAAHSGRTVYRSAEMADMLGSAQRGEFDVLLVGYVSRWQRNLRRDPGAPRGHPPPGRCPGLLLRRGDPVVVGAPLGPARR